MWQGAIRDRRDPAYGEVADAIETGDTITVELLYSDQVGEQRTITRFGLTPVGEEGVRIAAVTRHWFLDRPGPRSEHEVQAAAERAFRALEAASEEAEAAEEAVVDGAGSGPVRRELD
jgi:hypothetical protein